MKVVCVDDEKIALDGVLRSLKEIPLVTESVGFSSPKQCLNFLSEHPADVAILDISMRQTDGITLAYSIKRVRPEIRLIFLTGYSEFAVEAFKTRASGYLLKPASTKDIEEELKNIGTSFLPPPGGISAGNRVKVQTFGNFEVFVDGVPVKFPRAKCKELFAYLIDRRGSEATCSDISAVLFEDKPDDLQQKNYTRKVISETIKVFEQLGAADVIRKRYNNASVNISAVDCDYYRALAGDVNAFNNFAGEYMSNYSWAEFTLGELVNRNNRI